MLRLLLVVFGLPVFLMLAKPASASELLPVEYFARIPKASTAAISPDGKRIAVMMETDGKRVAAILPTDGSDDVFIASYEDYTPRWIAWATPDHLLMSISFAYRRGRAETTESRIAVLDMNKRELYNLIEFDLFRNPLKPARRVAQYQDSLLSTLPQDDENVLLSLSLKDVSKPGVYEFPVTGGRGDKVLRGRPGVQYWEADASGVVRLGWGFITRRGYERDRIRVIYRPSEGAEFEELAEFDADDPSSFDFAGFTENPDEILIYRDNEHGRTAVYRYNTRTRQSGDAVFSHEIYDAGSVIYVPDSDRPAAISYIAHAPELHFLDDEQETFQASLERKFPGQNPRLISRSSDGNKLLVRTENETSPPAFHYFDLAQAAYQYLANAYPELEGLELSITKPFDFKARDGLMIPGYLTVPKGAEAKNLPLIVHPHGGPRTRDFLDYDYWVQFFASRGWAVFQPNFRGSSGYGAGLEAAGLGEWGRAMQDDLTDGVQALISEGVADPDRICIVGSSYGGYASLQGLVKTPDLYACGVAVNPVTDIAEIISDRRYYTGFLRWREYWRQDDMAAVSPARHAEKITAPVMIAYSEDDRVVEPDHSTMMIDALKDADRKVEKVRLKDGDHSLSRHQNRVKLFQKMDAFLQAQIGLGPIPSGVSD